MRAAMRRRNMRNQPWEQKNGIILHMAKKSAKQSFGTGWVTTDEDERNIRHERAKTEKLSVRYLGGGSIAPFGDYEVSSQEGRIKKSYRVELRSLNDLVNSCSCPDFRKTDSAPAST